MYQKVLNRSPKNLREKPVHQTPSINQMGHRTEPVIIQGDKAETLRDPYAVVAWKGSAS